LRVRNTRDSREGGGNCCEMQELPAAGKLMSRWVGSPAACVGCYVKPQLNLGKLRMSEIGFSGRDDQLEIRSAELGEAVISIATRVMPAVDPSRTSAAEFAVMHNARLIQRYGRV